MTDEINPTEQLLSVLKVEVTLLGGVYKVNVNSLREWRQHLKNCPQCQSIFKSILCEVVDKVIPLDEVVLPVNKANNRKWH